MSKLSEHFSSEEFACKCGRPECHCLRASPVLVDKLEQIRSKLNKPIIITSGYRCPTHNREVGGVVNSYHIQGMAADFKVLGMTPDDILNFIEQNLPDIANSCGIGIYQSWVHIDVRGRKARWAK